MRFSRQWQLDAGIPCGYIVNVSEVALAMGQTDGSKHIIMTMKSLCKKRQVSRPQNAERNNWQQWKQKWYWLNTTYSLETF